MPADPKASQPHPHITFALEHYRGVFRTFDAASAIFRMRQLIEEADELPALLNPRQPEGLNPPALEFPAYYLVGYVTCFEWHARSRLADMLAHSPQSTTTDDVKAVTEGKKLLEMVTARLTVPELVGASTNVSKLRDYLAVFDRVFAVLSSGEDAATVLKARDVTGGESAWVTLDRMYEARHRLVHEVSNEQIGHYNLRAPLHLDEVTRIGQVALRCMLDLEAVITRCAGPEFPNLLGPDGYPVPEAERLLAEIQACERRLVENATAALNESEEMGIDFRRVGDVLGMGRTYVEAEIEWLRDFRPAGWRYHNPANDLEIRLLKGRLAYLRDVEEVLRTI